MKKTVFTNLFACLFILFITASCNNNSENKTTEENSTETTANTETTSQAPAEQQKVEITVNTVGENMGDMSYDKTELHVPAGAEVTLTLNNTSKDASMIHNIVFVNAGTEGDVATKGFEAFRNGNSPNYLPEDKSIYIAGSDVVGPGKSTKLVFTAPADKGTYKYICTYPGHWQKMQGTLIVE